jgi:acyl carrier protein
MAGMERDEVMKLVRDHLSTELEVVPESIQPETRFREDLDADSLDLYELVMELEDRYGIRVSEEEAAEIETVGDAVDFVCARVPDDARVLRSRGEGATR